MKKAAAIFIVILIMQSAAHAGLVQVEVRRGDTLHGFASKYLKDPKQWPKIYEINKDTIKDPNKIYPKQIVLIPVEMLKDKVGDITSIKKDVKVNKREGGGWIKGKQYERLFPEDGIMTGAKSFARVDFLVGSNLKVYENSLIYLKPSQKKTAVASLLEGGLNVKQAKIVTPAAEIVPKKNSVYDVNVDDKKTTRVSVRDGMVDVKALGEIVSVGGGFRTMIEMNKPPQKPVILPLSGEEAVGFMDDYLEKNITYQLQIAEKKAFEETLRDEITIDLSMDNIRKGLKPGTYYWRTAVVDPDGFIGNFSKPREIKIESAGEVFVELVGFEIVNRAEGIMKIRGYAEGAGGVTINGYQANLDSSGEFSTTIVLLPGQKTITAAAMGSGGVVLRKYHRTEEGIWIPAD
ncbi:LysM peptidoglycan-binding domain-containing protein [Elusimicrobiota bacterium]